MEQQSWWRESFGSVYVDGIRLCVDVAGRRQAPFRIKRKQTHTFSLFLSVQNVSHTNEQKVCSVKFEIDTLFD